MRLIVILIYCMGLLIAEQCIVTVHVTSSLEPDRKIYPDRMEIKGKMFTDQIALYPGAYGVTVDKKGFERHLRMFKIEEGQTSLTLNIELHSMTISPLGTQIALEQVIQELSTNHWTVKREVRKKLQENRSRAMIPGLVKYTKSSDIVKRKAAFEALAAIATNTRQAYKVLERILFDPQTTTDIQKQIVTSAGLTCSTKLSPLVLHALSSQSSELQITGLTAAMLIGAKEKAFIPKIIECSQSSEFLIKKKAMGILFEFAYGNDDIVEAAIRRLNDREHYVRAMALWALNKDYLSSSQRLDSLIIPHVIKKLNDSHDHVQTRAVQVLGSYDTLMSVRALENFIQTNHNNPNKMYVTSRAIMSLGYLKNNADVSFLVKCLESKHARIVGAAANALADLGKRAHVAANQLRAVFHKKHIISDNYVFYGVTRALVETDIKSEVMALDLLPFIDSAHWAQTLTTLDHFTKLPPQVVSKLVAICHNSLDPKAIYAAKVLLKTKKHQSLAQKIFKQKLENYDVFHRALGKLLGNGSLAKFAVPTVCEQLQANVHNDKPRNKMQAIYFLWQQGEKTDDEAIALIQEYLSSDKKLVLTYAASILSEMGVKAVPTFSQLWNKLQVRDLANALEKVDSEEWIPSLQKVASEGHFLWRIRALKTIEKIRG